ncbi:MAG: IS21-like element helper ATPase IstB [bacterium]
MIDEELAKMIKFLRLQGLLANWDRFLAMAQEENLSHPRLLKYIIEEEYKTRKENSRKMRLKRAQIPEQLVMETFPFQRQPNLDRKKIMAIYDSFDYMAKTQNIIWIGPTGTGKSGLATACLIKAINHGYSGRFILFPDLIEALYKSRADMSEHRLIKQFASYDCLLIDELGYVEIEPVQVGLFFTLMQKRHKQKTTLITSNLGFEQWISFLKNDQLTAALIDRLTENSHVINMKNCLSLRPRLVQS